ncbi:nitroreductase family protein [Pseudonocardia nematodicida]|uniref:Nitroreductase family protein n=1 Tax=Pseudonocardia nematodicida TaxID=1206997 RepID=A0ABV1KAU2_9PSEU
MSDPDLAVLRRLAGAPAVRTFDDRPVPPETVRALVDVVRRTGSARNRQPWRFVAVTDPQVRHALGRLGAYAQHLADAPCVVALLAADDGRRDTAFDVGRAGQTFTLAATAAGLGCCPATLYPEDNVDRARGLLRAPPGWTPTHCFSLGHPAPPPPGRSAVPRGRLPVDDLLTWI